MKKTPKCKGCGETGHYAISCRKTAKKPIRSHSKTLKAKKPKVPKKKVETRSQLKKRAWKAFSEYVRLRDCLATTGNPDYGTCITCVERGCYFQYPYKELQAGHAVGGRSNAVLFHEEIVNAQCRYCNQKPPMGLGGDYGNYAIALIKRYGIEHVESLQRLKGTDKKITTAELRELELHYKAENKRILNMSIDLQA